MESEITKSLNLYYKENRIKAYAYRFPQSGLKRQKGVSNQPCDILSDSENKKFYLAIEAKSIDLSKGKQNLNFKSRFTCTNGIHQIEHESFFCDITGRTGILAVELRYGPGKPKECYFVPMSLVYSKFKEGEKSLKLNEIRSSFKINRIGGKYNILKNIFKEDPTHETPR
jgi:hypothetical protein